MTEANRRRLTALVVAGTKLAGDHRRDRNDPRSPLACHLRGPFHMTLKDREDRFIEKCRDDLGTLTFEAEMLLRHGFAAGAQELEKVAYAEGVEQQRASVLDALGAVPRKGYVAP